MTEQQYEAVVAFFRAKVVKLNNSGDTSETEPWHIVHAALADPKVRGELGPVAILEGLQAMMSAFMAEAVLIALFGSEAAQNDAIQSGIICLVLEMAVKVAGASVVEGTVAA